MPPPFRAPTLPLLSLPPQAHNGWPSHFASWLIAISLAPPRLSAADYDTPDRLMISFTPFSRTLLR